MCLFNCLPYRKILFPESKVKLTLISPKLSDRLRRKSNVLPNSGPTLCTRCGKSCSCSATWRERLSDTKSKRCPRTFFTDKICPTLTWRISSNSSTDLIPEVTSRLWVKTASWKWVYFYVIIWSCELIRNKMVLKRVDFKSKGWIV